MASWGFLLECEFRGKLESDAPSPASLVSNSRGRQQWVFTDQRQSCRISRYPRSLTGIVIVSDWRCEGRRDEDDVPFDPRCSLYRRA